MVSLRIFRILLVVSVNRISIIYHEVAAKATEKREFSKQLLKFTVADGILKNDLFHMGQL